MSAVRAKWRSFPVNKDLKAWLRRVLVGFRLVVNPMHGRVSIVKAENGGNRIADVLEGVRQVVVVKSAGGDAAKANAFRRAASGEVFGQSKGDVSALILHAFGLLAPVFPGVGLRNDRDG